MWSATGGEAVTPHDANELAIVSRAIWFGGAGNASLLMADGASLTIVGIPAGTMLPLRVRRVNSTGTTATNMVSIY